MHRVNVYNYVLDSLNNILKNGIEYYDGKDKEIYNKLLMISKFIKDNSDISEEVIIKEEKCIDIPNPVIEEVNKYLDKVSKINIEVLNINKSLYINNKESIDINVNNEYNTINEKKEQDVPSKKTILDIFKW